MLTRAQKKTEQSQSCSDKLRAGDERLRGRLPRPHRGERGRAAREAARRRGRGAFEYRVAKNTLLRLRRGRLGRRVARRALRAARRRSRSRSAIRSGSRRCSSTSPRRTRRSSCAGGLLDGPAARRGRDRDARDAAVARRAAREARRPAPGARRRSSRACWRRRAAQLARARRGARQKRARAEAAAPRRDSAGVGRRRISPSHRPASNGSSRIARRGERHGRSQRNRRPALEPHGHGGRRAREAARGEVGRLRGGAGRRRGGACAGAAAAAPRRGEDRVRRHPALRRATRRSR